MAVISEKIQKHGISVET